jgi:peptide/nickel transport system permease protein
MGRFLLRRLFHSLFVVIGISMVIFVISRVVPGDPARMALGENAPAEVVQALRVEMHLDKPIYQQYYFWCSGVVRGDFGKSLMTNQPVLRDIKETLPATLEIAMVSGIIMVFLSIFLGSLSAWYRDSFLDGTIRLVSYVCVAVPGFVAAILFVMVFGYFWHLLPVIGRIETANLPRPITGFMLVDSLLCGRLGSFKDALEHLLLPAVAISLASAFQAARITRSSMVDNMNKDYIAAERGYGIPERHLAFKFLLKPSLIPTISVLGLSLANIVSTAFLVELIFNWPGIARYGLQAMLNKDLNAISAVILVTGIMFAIVNIIVDIIIAKVDPRIRLDGGKVA